MPHLCYILITEVVAYNSYMKRGEKVNNEKIKELRIKKGLTQEELSNRLGIDRTHLSKIETGRVKPSLSLLERIASELGVQLKKFF